VVTSRLTLSRAIAVAAEQTWRHSARARPGGRRRVAMPDGGFQN